MSLRALTQVAAAVAVAVVCAASAGVASASAAPAAIVPPLHVDGTVLRDATGQRVGLKGVAVQMVPYYAGATPTTQQTYLLQVTNRNFDQRDAEFAAIRALGYDAIRVHIAAPDVYESELYESKAAAVARIQSIVDSAKAAGLVTILDANATGDTMGDWRSYEPMFADLIASIGNDPWVVWEPFNEPADYAPGSPTYLAAVEGIGAYLRSLGSLQPLIIPSDGYEQEVSPTLMNDILGDAAAKGWRGTGLLFGVHVYLDQYAGYGDTFTGVAFDALDNGIAAHLSSYPLIVTEMGRYNNDITMTNATAAAYQWVAALGTQGLNGLIAWDWDWTLDEATSDPNAWTWDGLHLNPWGQQSNAAVSTMTFPEPAAATSLTPPATPPTHPPVGGPVSGPTTAPAATHPVPGRKPPPGHKPGHGVSRAELFRAVSFRHARAELLVSHGVLRVVFKSPFRYPTKIRLTVSRRSFRRAVTVSRTRTVRRGRRVLRWKLPRRLAGGRSFTVRITYYAPRRVSGTAHS